MLPLYRRLPLLLGLAAVLFVATSLADAIVPPSPGLGGATGAFSAPMRPWLYLPMVVRPEIACQPIPGASYGTLSVESKPTDRPADVHADLNLALRGYALTSATKGLVTYGVSADTDSNAPQLAGLFADNRVPAFANVYRVYDWNWTTNTRGSPIATWAVTLAGFAVQADETIQVPSAGYTIGSGYQVLVLYATNQRITLKYTRDDNVISGYTVHVENVCVAPDLVALYQSMNRAGRGQLPALQAGQPFGRASMTELGVAIRDTGAFMDPRSRNDWWQGR